jgi:hypothetical protein
MHDITFCSPRMLPNFSSIACGQHCDPPAAEGRACPPKKLKAARAETEIFNKGIHFGWFAHWISGITFPDDDIGICKLN